MHLPWSQRLSFTLYWKILRRESLLIFVFIDTKRWEPRKESFLFLPTRRFDQRFAPQISKRQKMILKESLWDQGMVHPLVKKILDPPLLVFHQHMLVFSALQLRLWTRSISRTSFPPRMFSVVCIFCSEILVLNRLFFAHIHGTIPLTICYHV